VLYRRLWTGTEAIFINHDDCLILVMIFSILPGK